jgi:AraC-like DNA-binding protein
MTTQATKMPPRYFLLAFRHFGTTPELRRAILEGTGVTEESLADSSRLIDLEQLQRQQDNLGRLFGEDWAVSAPELWSHATYGQLSVASQAAVDLRQALSLIIDNATYIGILFRYSLRSAETKVRFIYTRLFEMEDKYYRRRLEIGFISMRSLFYLYRSRPPSELRYLFSCPEHEYADRVREVLGGEVEFGAAEEGIEFPLSWLQLESPLHDIETLQAASRRMALEYLALAASGSVGARVERFLATAPTGFSKQSEVATALALSQRTLVRRLSEEGTTFRKLLEVDLERRAGELRESRSLKVADVSAQLGYSDPGSFARARRRWADRIKGNS